MKVVFIQSVSFSGFNGLSYTDTYVYDLPDDVANECIDKGFAIPFDGCEKHPKRPPYIRFP
ncbi:hypothetical protein ASG65_20855 [Bacillus sp. Leaf13]|nr:hypothetical protein ASG65_20855 [Bacillus sp. Leaf13]